MSNRMTVTLVVFLGIAVMLLFLPHETKIYNEAVEEEKLHEQMAADYEARRAVTEPMLNNLGVE